MGRILREDGSFKNPEVVREERVRLQTQEGDKVEMDPRLYS